MFKLLRNLHNKVKHKVERIQRNTKIIQNVNLLMGDELVKNNRILKNVFAFIVKNDHEALEALTDQLRVPELKVTHILAEDLNGCMGSNFGSSGKLDWSAPEDMKHFVEKTTGKICIVGGITFRSFGTYILKNRTVIVVTKDSVTSGRVKALSNHYCVSTVEEALEVASFLIGTSKTLPREIMVIGGASIYRQTLHLVTDVWLSKINVAVKGNIFRDWTYSKAVNVNEITFEGKVK
jgi:dihydrofolate reductase